MKCKYNDCGWCYAPNTAVKNDNNGQCNNPSECHENDDGVAAELDEMARINQETGQYDATHNPMIKDYPSACSQCGALASDQIVKPAPKYKPEITALQEENERLKAELSKFKPSGWWFQHEETGHVAVIDDWQVSSGFEAANPRLQKVGRVYIVSEALQEKSDD